MWIKHQWDVYHSAGTTTRTGKWRGLLPSPVNTFEFTVKTSIPSIQNEIPAKYYTYQVFFAMNVKKFSKAQLEIDQVESFNIYPCE